MAPNYAYLVVSEPGQVEKAADEVLSIIQAAHCRTENRIHYLKEES